MDSSLPNARRLTRLYICALSLVAGLTVVGQLLVQQQLQRQASDSHIVNIAGRQRMLSQKLLKTALHFSVSSDFETPTQLADNLRGTLAEWKANHALLRQGDPRSSMPANNSDRIGEMFVQLEPKFQAISKAAERLADSSWGKQNSDALDSRQATLLRDTQAAMLRSDQAYLSGMDSIVYQYALEARQRVESLQRVEHWLLLATLAVLLAEGVFIFRPTAKRIAATEEELRRSSQQLQWAKDEAEAATQTKTRFLANVSHELRTPMNAIIGLTELASLTDDQAVRKQYLANVDEAAQSLLRLLDDLIETSRSDIANMRFEEQPLAIKDIVARSVRMLQTSATEKQLAIRFHVETDVPEQLLGDAARLQQVLVNLTSNAIKYTEQGTISLSASVANRSPDSVSVRFAVEDTGIGIAANQQAKIFDEFTQVELPESQSRGGVGLGLAICKHLVERMEGKLTVQSSPGEGSVFSFTLPLKKVSELARSSEVREQPSIEPLDILVIDDTPLNQTVTCELLKQLGHTPSAVGDTEKALQQYRDEAYDLVLMDICMPGMSGYELAGYMQKMDKQLRRAETPLVALTAYPMIEYRQKSMDAGMRAHLAKPLKRVDLQAAISAALQQSNLCPSKETQLDLDAEAGSAAGGDFRRELVRVFHENLPAALSELTEAVSGGDSRKVELLAHRFRGQLVTLGESEIAAKFAQLEASAKASGDFSKVRELWAECSPWMERLALELETQANAVKVPAECLG